MTCGRDELGALLERAGLDVVKDGRRDEVLPPGSAWRAVTTAGAEPAPTVRCGRSGVAAGFDARWRRLAAEHGVLGGDGTFLIDVACDRSCRCSRSWTRVRLTDDGDLTGVLRERPGQPEFVTVSADGDTVIGVFTEEDDVRLVVVDRLAERLETASHKAVQESAEERAAAWASVGRGPEPSEELRAAWTYGLSLNPAFPDRLRGGLLGRSRILLYRPLPAAVVEEAIVHPDPRVRTLLAEVHPGITTEQWTRLILGEQETRARWLITMCAADRHEELPGMVHERLVSDPSAKVREETARLTGLPAHLLTALAADIEPSVRAAVCRNAWPRLDGPARAALLDDPDTEVRAAALLRHHRDHPLPGSVFESEGLGDSAVESCLLERALAARLARHGTRSQRSSLARNARLDPDLVMLLARDPDAYVRYVVSVRPDLTEEQRSGVDVVFRPDERHAELDWVRALHGDPDAMRRLAASSHPAVRRSVARARHLPPDVVARLADDEDPVVQLFLAESCDDAPAGMLLRVWEWWTGSLSFPDRPRGHPNFPRRGLLRYADDPRPGMRRLAPDDPDSTPGLVERLSRDDDKDVRYRAATDPRLTPASAVRLLDDPDRGVRHAASQHPGLPARVLVRLLWDTESAQAAADHPSVPVPVLEEMLRMIHRTEDTVTAP